MFFVRKLFCYHGHFKRARFSVLADPSHESELLFDSNPIPSFLSMYCIERHRSSLQESESIAASVPDSAGVYFVPAFNGLLAPHWRDDARGVIVGLTQYSTKASAGLGEEAMLKIVKGSLV